MAPAGHRLAPVSGPPFVGHNKQDAADSGRDQKPA